MAKETTTKKKKTASPKAAVAESSNVLDAKVFNVSGKEVTTLSLPETVFGQQWNADLVHQVIVSMQSNARAGTAHTKFRGEVRGGGKKPWKQKGTGRARHGSRRSPIWVGGGVAHGPRTEKDYSKKINRNMSAKALAIVLSKKFADGEVLFVDTFGLSAVKAKQAQAALKGLSTISGASTLATKRKNAGIVLLPERDEVSELSFRNFGNMLVRQAKDINPVDLVTYKYLLVPSPDATLKVLETRVAPKHKRTK